MDTLQQSDKRLAERSEYLTKEISRLEDRVAQITKQIDELKAQQSEVFQEQIRRSER